MNLVNYCYSKACIKLTSRSHLHNLSAILRIMLIISVRAFCRADGFVFRASAGLITALIKPRFLESKPPLINDIINDAETSIDGIYVLRLVKTSSRPVISCIVAIVLISDGRYKCPMTVSMF